MFLSEPAFLKVICPRRLVGRVFLETVMPPVFGKESELMSAVVSCRAPLSEVLFYFD